MTTPPAATVPTDPTDEAAARPALRSLRLWELQALMVGVAVAMALAVRWPALAAWLFAGVYCLVLPPVMVRQTPAMQRRFDAWLAEADRRGQAGLPLRVFATAVTATYGIVMAVAILGGVTMVLTVAVLTLRSLIALTRG